MSRKMEDGILMWKGSTHMSINVKGGLKNLNMKRLPEIYQELKKADFEGKKVIPLNDDCDNYDFQTGCRGHTTFLLVEDWFWENGNG